VRDIRYGNILLSGKVVQVHPRSPGLSPINMPHMSFYRYSVVTLVAYRYCFV